MPTKEELMEKKARLVREIAGLRKTIKQADKYQREIDAATK